MRSFEIVVDHAQPDSPSHDGSALAGFDTRLAPSDSMKGLCRTLTAARTPARQRRKTVMDLFVDGANITARVNDEQGASVVRDMAEAVASLAPHAGGKRIVRFYEDAYELALQRRGRTCLLSLYRAGAEPHVVVYNKSVPFADVAEGLARALSALPLDEELVGLGSALNAIVREKLEGVERAHALVTSDERGAHDADAWTHEVEEGVSVKIGARFSLVGVAPSEGLTHETSDLHALLFPGRLSLRVRERELDLGEGRPFILAERLLGLVPHLMDAWVQAREQSMAFDLGAVGFRARVASTGTVALSVGPRSADRRRGGPSEERAVCTFPGLPVLEFSRSIVDFCRALVRALLKADRSQSKNLRLRTFRRTLREVTSTLRAASQTDAVINAAPHSYRAFAQNEPPASERRAPARVPSRLRYAAKWTAMVPGIDLAGTFLSGQRVVLSSTSEVYAIHRDSGATLWRSPVQRGVSVMTPCGLARVGHDGTVQLHELETGAVTLRTWISPRRSGAPSGAVVHASGLPRLLIVTEGERHIVALDLMSGETRWRFALGDGGTTPPGPHAAPMAVRLRRSGRLLYVASGSHALSALDVVSGKLVWRSHDRRRFFGAPLVAEDAKDQCFAIAGGFGFAAEVVCFDAHAGSPRWTESITDGTDGVVVDGGLLMAQPHLLVPVRKGRNAGVVAYDRETGAMAWRTPMGAVPAGTAWAVAGQVAVGNTPSGEAIGLDVSTGRVLYRRSLGQSLQLDVPRTLTPAVKNGLAFLPHADVHVLRPEDGAQVAKLAQANAIADVLRVDERSDILACEDSGHVAAYAAQVTLSVVREGLASGGGGPAAREDAAPRNGLRLVERGV